MPNFSLEGPSLLPDSQAVKRIVFLFHGYGSNGFDLIELSPYFRPFLPDTLFIAPNAPKAFPLGDGGFAWFDLPNLSKETSRAGIKEASPLLKTYIEEVIAHYNVAHENVVLAGFSQGAMMALYTAPLFDKVLGGTLAFSAPFVRELFLENLCKTKPPVALIHGDADEVVTEHHFQSAKETLLSEGFNVKSLLVKGLPHSINGQAVGFAAEFLKDVLPNT